MRAPRTVERNVLLALYHHAMLTAEQLRILLRADAKIELSPLQQMDQVQDMVTLFRERKSEE